MHKPLKRTGHHGPRRAATNEQRHALRQWWNDDSYGVRNLKDAIAWWLSKFSCLPTSQHQQRYQRHQ
jgi:hypothetical protein